MAWPGASSDLVSVLVRLDLCQPLVCGVAAEQVCQGRPHAKDHNGQTGHERGDLPRCPGYACLGQKVIGDLACHAEDQRRYRGPAGETAGPVTDDGVAGEPYMQRECGVGFDADWQGNGGVEVQGAPESASRWLRRTRR
jgi:hypothetical protein